MLNIEQIREERKRLRISQWRLAVCVNRSGPWLGLREIGYVEANHDKGFQNYSLFEFEAPESCDQDTVTMIGRGIAFSNDWSMDDTFSCVIEGTLDGAAEQDMFEAGGVEPEVHQEGEPEHEHDEEMHEGFMVALPEDGTGTIKFTVTEGMVGKWEIGCFEQDGVHYDAGMKGSVNITQ